jgi:hypothetical protein
MTDILAQIDAVTDERCACGCEQPLDPQGASGWFAGQACQQRWQERQATDPHDVYRRNDPAYVIRTAARWVPPETVEQQEARLAARQEARDRMVAEIRLALDEAAAGVTRFFEALGNALRPGLAELASAAKRLQAAGVIDEVVPDDPMARALYLRRNRNTGPKQPLRAPRRIDARSPR